MTILEIVLLSVVVVIVAAMTYVLWANRSFVSLYLSARQAQKGLVAPEKAGAEDGQEYTPQQHSEVRRRMTATTKNFHAGRISVDELRQGLAAAVVAVKGSELTPIEWQDIEDGVRKTLQMNRAGTSIRGIGRRSKDR